MRPWSGIYWPLGHSTERRGEKMQVMEIRHIPVSTKERDQRVDSAMALWWMETIDTFVRRVGEEEALRALMPVFRHIGRQDARNLVLEKEIWGRDALALATYVNFWEEMLGIRGQVMDITPDRIVKENVSCPLARGPPESCKLMECIINGAAEEMAPDFSFHDEMAIPCGDNKCRWIIERKK